jgi:hypothetical protein
MAHAKLLGPVDQLLTLDLTPILLFFGARFQKIRTQLVRWAQSVHFALMRSADPGANSPGGGAA